MVRKQNERTLILQSRIIPLSLPTKSIFHILAPLAPFPQDWGLSLPPKHFPANFFRNFFQSDQGDFFLYFWCENYVFLGRTFFYFFGAKNYGGEGHLSLLQWGGGGVPCPMLPYIAGIPFCPLVFPFPAYHQGKKPRKQGKTGQKLDFIWCALVFSRCFGRPKGAKY